MNKRDPLEDHPEVKALKKSTDGIRALAPHLTRSQAIEVAARSKGFRTYASFRASLRDVRT